MVVHGCGYKMGRAPRLTYSYSHHSLRNNQLACIGSLSTQLRQVDMTLLLVNGTYVFISVFFFDLPVIMYGCVCVLMCVEKIGLFEEEEWKNDGMSDLLHHHHHHHEGNNAFGNSFRDYDKESQRQESVEEFYRVNHINQTLDFVSKI